MTFGLIACGGSSSSGDTTSAGDQGSSDSFMAAWPKARDAVAAVAPDAVLVSSGTRGLAFADVPETWNFTFFSPERGMAYSVDVEHGKVDTPREFGSGQKGVKVTSGPDVEALKVSAGDAVVKARAFGEQSGAVPKNVVVSSVFGEFPDESGAGYKTGVWTVAFATGTDMADARTFEVDMMTGEVTEVKSN